MLPMTSQLQIDGQTGLIWDFLTQSWVDPNRSPDPKTTDTTQSADVGKGDANTQ